MKHRVCAIIDLDAVEYNINNVRKKIGDETKLLAVIKADAYGHGAVEIAKKLADKVDFFGVACVIEAMELVEANLNVPILILGKVFDFQLEQVVANNIRVPISSFEEALAISNEAVKQNKIAKVHICVDTGMSRIGFQVNEENVDICIKISNLPGIKLEGAFSHFATADEKDLSKSIEQKRKFDFFVGLLEEKGLKIEIKHISNSAGIMVFDDKLDMVRSGIVTYGMYPSEEVDKSLLSIKPVMQWKTLISQVKVLPAGREISYGGTYVTDKETVVATVPVGYADGYPRCLSNIGRVIVNGEYANILGRVCMDQLMIDVTHISDVNVGDTVTLVGVDGKCRLTMEEVANNAHSFNYELPCRIPKRVPRVYIENGKEVATVIL